MDMGARGVAGKEVSSIRQQLALAVRLNDEATFDEFCWTGNALLQEQLLPVLTHPVGRFFYVWGRPGSGKSHLLQACCHKADLGQHSARYVPLSLLQTWDPAVLEGMEDHAVVAIDDVDRIAGRSNWEEALFHLFNRICERQAVLIITALVPPLRMGIRLADLSSRLTSGLVAPLYELADEDKILTLQARAHKRGFELPRSVGQYLVNHCARSMHDLYSVFECLDNASLVAQRKLTVPFVKEVLRV
jgi:DnaA-homolog protein